MARGQSRGIGSGAGVPGGIAPNLQTKFVLAPVTFPNSGAGLAIESLPVDFSDSKSKRQIGFSDVTLNLLILSASLIPLTEGNLASWGAPQQRPAVQVDVSPNLLTSTLAVAATPGSRAPTFQNQQTQRSVGLDTAPNITARLGVAKTPFIGFDAAYQSHRVNVEPIDYPNLALRSAVSASPFISQDVGYRSQRVNIQPIDAPNLTIRNTAAVASPFVPPTFEQFIARRNVHSDTVPNVVISAPQSTAPFTPEESGYTQTRKGIGVITDVNATAFMQVILPAFQMDVFAAQMRPPWVSLETPQNLLHSTLAPVAGASPFNPQDFSARLSRPEITVSPVENLQHSTLSPAATTKVRAAVFQNQQVPRSYVIDVLPNRTLAFGPGVAATPFVPPETAWRQSRGDVFADVVLNLTAQPSAPVPFAQTDWPNAQNQRAVQSWAVVNTLPKVAPFLPVDQQLAPARREIGLIPAPLNFALANTVPPAPFTPIEFVPPQRKVNVNDSQAWNLNLLHGTLQPVIVYPFHQNDWPSPILSVSRYQQDYYYNGALMATALPPIVPVADETIYGAVHLRQLGRDIWHKRTFADETEQEKRARRIKAGIIQAEDEALLTLAPRHVDAIKKTAAKIAQGEDVPDELEREFQRAMMAQAESSRLMAQLLYYEMLRIKDDEVAAIMLLM